MTSPGPNRSLAVHRNADTWLSLEQTAAQDWDRTPYRKTHDFPGERIDDYHRLLGEAPLLDGGYIDLKITGWLLPADALKLYELAYFGGDVLELGTCCGLSTSVISRAIHNSGRESVLATVDLDPTIHDGARWHMEQQSVPRREAIRYFHAEGAAFVAGLIARPEAPKPSLLDRLRGRHPPMPEGIDALPRRFSLAFVDHAHTYEAMIGVCPLLHRVVEPGGFVLFHDYNDPRNIVPEATDYGVYQAVAETLSKDHFEFHGVFGCTGLYRRNDRSDEAQ